MENYCVFSKNHKCLNWTDYELTRYELEEAGSLCQANWIEIERKNEYIQLLQSLLDKMVSHIQSNNDSLTLKGLAFARPSSSPLKFAPHECPSRRTLNNYAVFIMKPSRKPLNKFGKPSQTLIIPIFFRFYHGNVPLSSSVYQLFIYV